eukprot:517890_1
MVNQKIVIFLLSLHNLTSMAESNWITLKSQEIDGDIGIPFMINNDEFVVVASFDQGIHTYNINQNEWTIIDAGIDIDINAHGCAFNKQKQSLFVCDGFKLLEFDLNKERLKEQRESSQLITHCPSLIYVNDKLHAVFGNPVKHMIWNKQTNDFKEIYQFDEFTRGIQDHALVHLKSKKCILLFGGEDLLDFWTDNQSDLIYEYSLSTHKWNKLNIKMPEKLSRFGIVSTRFDQYIIILGGLAFYGIGCDSQCSDNIYFYDIKCNSFRKSKVKCPKLQFRYNAVITNNKYNDELLTFGFINKCYKSNKFINLKHLPVDLIKLIGK